MSDKFFPEADMEPMQQDTVKEDNSTSRSPCCRFITLITVILAVIVVVVIVVVATIHSDDKPSAGSGSD